MLTLPLVPPISEILLDKDVRLFMKREDLIHPEISGNKYWKLFYNINSYLATKPVSPLLITFGGAFSNHIAAVAALGKEQQLRTLGIIRGEEVAECVPQNPTLRKAADHGMAFRFVSRQRYREKISLTKTLEEEFPEALIFPEGGTNDRAVEGIRHMLTEQTKSFDYLCTAVGTGGTVAGLSRFAEENQRVIGFKVVKDETLESQVYKLSGRRNFQLRDAFGMGYGKISDDNICFINTFYTKTGIPLEPIYTGKMMQELLKLIEGDYFPRGSRILAFHTGGLQGREGANNFLKNKQRPLLIL